MKAKAHKTGRNATGKSDSSVVPTKPPNKSDELAEAVEERELAEGNAWEQVFPRTQSRKGESVGLQRVREIAEKDKKLRLNNLLHHMDEQLLRKVFFGLKKEASPGVDGVTWRVYGENLEDNLRDLHRRVHQGSYRALPAKKAEILKEDGSNRTISMGAIEDKIVQQALAVILSKIYEGDFLGFSYGFRTKRCQHDALDALSTALISKTSWVLDMDIKGFFDNVDHEWLIKFLEHRIGDKRVLRLIQKWLSMAITDGVRKGVPQGAPISPLLGNIYLHYALDLWFHRWWRKKVAEGETYIVRYADDVVVCFQLKRDADRFFADVKNRLGKFKLTLHPVKTRLFNFGRFALKSWREGKGEKPQTFEFLGFTHISGETREGNYVVLRKSSSKRQRKKLKEIREHLMKYRHQPIPETGRWLKAVLKGYSNYHAVPLNYRALSSLRSQVGYLWLMALRRRGQKHKMTFEKFDKIREYWLPKPIIIHPYPWKRFRANHPKQEPYAGNPPVRIRAGGGG